MTTKTDPDSCVIFHEHRAANGRVIAQATLNSERTLNALTLDMIRLLHAQLTRWRDDPAVVLVLLTGSGERAFCAGGDVRALAQALSRDPASAGPFATTYFHDEYALDYAMHGYPKPILVWGSGIVMGGGLGLMAGASHRVVTETSRIAMPEISIGLFPDVGGSWFLNRMPGRIGLFLGLTGAPLNAADAQFVGLADFALRSTELSALSDALLSTDWSGETGQDSARLSALLRERAALAAEAMPAGRVHAHYDRIQELTDADSLSDVAARFRTASDDIDPWIRDAMRTFAAGCPTTAGLVWEIRRRARHLGLADVFRLELILAVQCCLRGEFVEGVRARLIDKDNAPRWKPADLAGLDADWIDGFFAPPWPVHPLASL